jgi:hypothetical protein
MVLYTTIIRVADVGKAIVERQAHGNTGMRSHIKLSPTAQYEAGTVNFNYVFGIYVICNS